MQQLIVYFKQKPTRVFFALIWLVLVGAVLYGVGWEAAGAEIFTTLVHDPDHRMHAEDKHFSGLNSDNIRSEHEPSQIKDSDFNILFLGDSFVYGFLMSPELSPPVQLENLLRERYHRTDINVINFGWTSSSPILDFRLLKDIGVKYKPDLILLALDMSDYRDEWFYKSVLERRGFYQFVVSYPRTSFWIKTFLEWLAPVVDFHSVLWGYPAHKGGYFVANQPLEASRPLFDELYSTLLQMDGYIKTSMQVPFVVFVPPRHWQYTDKEAPGTWEKGSFTTMGSYALENFRYFEEKKPVTPFPLVLMLDDFKQATEYPLNFKVDSHWNKNGARFFAERVEAHCEAQGLLNALQ